MDCNETFARMINFMEFTLDKDDEGYRLIDDMETNLGGIEQDRFHTAKEIVERMDTYIGDYMLDDEEEGSYETVEEAMKKKPDHALMTFFDLIVNHINEVDLDKAIACQK